jgi:hypothetical protein
MFQLKTSDDLEIYEVEQASKDKFEEICDIRQPVIFDFENKSLIHCTRKQYIFDNYPSFELKLRNTNETDINNEKFMPFPIHFTNKLFDNNTQNNYYTENNQDMLKDTGIVKNMMMYDEYLRPRMISNSNYDIMMGSHKCCTPFKYELNYRNFFLTTQGEIRIKLASPKSIKYLYPMYDYENFEFYSQVNPWNVQSNYKMDFDKIKCLEVVIPVGKTIFIPAFWWYSIQFGKDTSVTCFKYRTYMNNIAISPYIGMHYLQIQNVKRNSVKVAEPSSEDSLDVIDDSPKEVTHSSTETSDSCLSTSDGANTGTGAPVNTVSTLNHNPLNSHSDIFDTVTEITNETN